MQRSTKRLCSILLMLCSPFAFAKDACPEVGSISRVPGEYAWVSTDGRWEGYFVSPRIGRGDSNEVKNFRQARWIQLTNLIDSAGVVECDYQGNYGEEVIRFVQLSAASSEKPKSQNWSCELNPDLPGTQCLCGGEATECW
jgi:hypothetical protein